MIVCVELERSQEVALSLEEKSKEAERERNELTEAQKRAEAARQRAEQAANLEKEERERKVWIFFDGSPLSLLFVCICLYGRLIIFYL